MISDPGCSLSFAIPCSYLSLYLRKLSRKEPDFHETTLSRSPPSTIASVHFFAFRKCRSRQPLRPYFTGRRRAGRTFLIRSDRLERVGYALHGWQGLFDLLSAAALQR